MKKKKNVWENLRFKGKIQSLSHFQLTGSHLYSHAEIINGCSPIRLTGIGLRGHVGWRKHKMGALKLAFH